MDETTKGLLQVNLNMNPVMAKKAKSSSYTYNKIMLLGTHNSQALNLTLV